MYIYIYIYIWLINVSFWPKENCIFCIIFLYFLSYYGNYRTCIHRKTCWLWKSRHKPPGITCQAPQESFGSKNGKMAFETRYWLTFWKWSEVIKELTESNLLMYLNIYIVEQPTPWVRYFPSPNEGRLLKCVSFTKSKSKPSPCFL